MEALRRNGLWAEAFALESSDRIDEGVALLDAGRALTVACPDYPSRWIEVLGASAPPALWIRGNMPPAPYLAVVGSRKLSSSDWRFASEVGRQAVLLGYTVVSGGAEGADRSAIAGAASVDPRRALEIWPRGIDRGPLRSRNTLSTCEPLAEFSASQAMERNALIYASAAATVIIRARFREGGTWIGASNALRSRLSKLIVQDVPGDLAAQALIAMGSIPLSHPQGLAQAMRSVEHERTLFAG